MKKLCGSEQSGRSMVEMLGVLAIIGVLSVGGISGYSKAMAKYRTTQTLDQIAMIVANIRTAFASQTTYTGLDTAAARQWGLTPTEMFSTKEGENENLFSPFQEPVYVGVAKAHEYADQGFVIQYNNLPSDACVAIATANWGEAFLGVAAGADGDTPPGEPGDGLAASGGVVNFAAAANLCTTDGNANSIALLFY